MRSRISKILVTGGAGFIGSEFIRYAVKRGFCVALLDKLTYAGDLERLKEVKGRYKFYKGDICNRGLVNSILKQEKCEIIINFAAETHVDRSILASKVFLETNCLGTQVLLDASRQFGIRKFIHLSTDEVYGDIKSGRFNEDSPLKPNSPYAASKAAADLLIKSYIRTYDFPAIILRPSNNYGPWQYPEKLIPVIVSKALKNENVPVYAKGLNVREWLFVEDTAQAIAKIIEKGKVGEVYNVGSECEETNIKVVKTILSLLNKPKSLIRFVRDRPGHDFRYSLDSRKINKLGWKARTSFDAGINQTVNWYVQNLNWVEKNIKILKAYWGEVYKENPRVHKK